MSHRKNSRRDFLRGKAAADALVARLEQAGTPTDHPAPRDEGYLVRVGRDAMAGRFEIFLNAGQYPRGVEVALETLDLVDALEAQLSIFRPASEICTINREAAQRSVEVESGLFSLLATAVQLYHETGGALDITAAPLSDVWGFSRRQGRLPTPEELDAARALVGCDRVELDPEAETVRFTTPGVRLSLGAIGKGYALDRCAERLLDEGVNDFIIHGGQSSVLAHGSTLADPDGGWPLGVHHPLRHEQRLAELRLRDAALATSGSEKQFFRHHGRRLSHILDPRTGQPAEGLLSATVIAPNAAMADGLSTALFVLGAQRAIEFCRCRPELGAVLVRQLRGEVDVLTQGVAPEDFRRVES